MLLHIGHDAGTHHALPHLIAAALVLLFCALAARYILARLRRNER